MDRQFATKTIAGIGMLVAAALVAGCASHPQYIVAAPPPPPAAYETTLIDSAERNGFADGAREGQRDRYEGKAYRPTHSDRYEDAPGYYRELGGTHDQYRYYYREGFARGYREGYRHF